MSSEPSRNDKDSRHLHLVDLLGRAGTDVPLRSVTSTDLLYDEALPSPTYCVSSRGQVMVGKDSVNLQIEQIRKTLIFFFACCMDNWNYSFHKILIKIHCLSSKNCCSLFQGYTKIICVDGNKADARLAVFLRNYPPKTLGGPKPDFGAYFLTYTRHGQTNGSLIFRLYL